MLAPVGASRLLRNCDCKRLSLSRFRKKKRHSEHIRRPFSRIENIRWLHLQGRALNTNPFLSRH